MRIALLAFRGTPHSGGQGIYVQRIASALAGIGHEVEVLSGPPYPDLDPALQLHRIPSLELYRPEEPFAPVRPVGSVIDALELVVARTGGYPEPLAFSLRAARWLAQRPGHFDVVHDNQSLGYGLLDIARRCPVVATIHHPITVDLSLELSKEPNRLKRATLKRFYAFARMQRRVGRRLQRLITVSSVAKQDVLREFGFAPARVAVVPNGVDPTVFQPRPDGERRRGRIVTTTRPDMYLKGFGVLLEALARVRTQIPEAHLEVVGRAEATRQETEAAMERLGITGAVTFHTDPTTEAIVDLHATAEVAVVASRYEGFSLPAIEAMACGLPLVTTTGGALPEVAGKDGQTALLVPPGDARSLADALVRVLSDADLRARIGEAGRLRVLERFTWEAAAKATVEVYREAGARES